MSSGKRAAETDGLRRASQHSSDKNRHYKLLRNIVMCTMALAFLVACDCEEAVIKTHQEAFEALKKKVLSDPDYLKELSAIGADESIFDNVQIVPTHLAAKRGLTDYPCNRPKKYSTYAIGHYGKKRDVFIEYIKTYEIIKGSCDKCWNLIKISGLLARGGYVSDVKFRSKPSLVIKSISAIKSLSTINPGDEREYCGPAYDYP